MDSPRGDQADRAAKPAEPAAKPAASKTAAQLAKFAGSSFASFAVDWAVFSSLWNLLPQSAPGRLAASVATARCMSLIFNFACNTRLVFRAGAGTGLKNSNSGPDRACARYLLLAAAILAGSWALLKAVHAFFPGFPLSVAKPGVDYALFLVSFRVQQRYVFSK